MANPTSKIYYRIDLRRTLNLMQVNAPVLIKITGANRDCDLSAIYYAKSAIESNSNKVFTLTKKDLGEAVEITRIR